MPKFHDDVKKAFKMMCYKEKKNRRNSKYEHIHITAPAYVAPPHPFTHTTTKIHTWVILPKTGPKRVPLSQSNKN